MSICSVTTYCTKNARDGTVNVAEILSKHISKKDKKRAPRNVRTVGEVSGLDDHALALVIDAHLGAVQHHGAHHVRVDAAVEARNTCVGGSAE